MKKAIHKWLKLSPASIAIIYLVVAGLWITTTDRLLNSWITNSSSLTLFQTLKGWFYVVLTSLGLYLLIRKYETQIRSKTTKLEGVRSKYRTSRELRDRLFERIPVMITIYDRDYNDFEVNREFEKVTGWSNRDAGEINLLEACYPDLERREEVVDFMDDPGIGWKEFAMTTKAGDTVKTSWTNIRLSDETSVGIGIDMTEIRDSEAKLRESQKLLKRTFDSLEESVILVDLETRSITDCNPATEKVFGYSKEELVGKSTRMLHVDEESFKEFGEKGQRALEEQGIFHTEYQMKKKNGEVFYSDHTVSLVYDEGGEVGEVVSVVRDITDRKLSEQRVIQSVIETEDRERKRIARELHDGIGQYLSASNMNLESVRNNIGPLSEKDKDRFNTGLALLKQAIDETRNAAQNLMPGVLEDYGLNLAVETLTENLEQSTEIDFTFDSNIDDSELESQVAVNLYRIIQEAVNNAVVHGDCSTIAIRLHRADGQIQCRIEDDGQGAELEEGDLKKGIGLRSMRTRTHALSGTIEFNSEPGKGMTVDVQIPLNNPSPE